MANYRKLNKVWNDAQKLEQHKLSVSLRQKWAVSLRFNCFSYIFFIIYGWSICMGVTYIRVVTQGPRDNILPGGPMIHPYTKFYIFTRGNSGKYPKKCVTPSVLSKEIPNKWTSSALKGELQCSEQRGCHWAFGKWIWPYAIAFTKPPVVPEQWTPSHVTQFWKLHSSWNFIRGAVKIHTTLAFDGSLEQWAVQINNKIFHFLKILFKKTIKHLCGFKVLYTPCSVPWGV